MSQTLYNQNDDQRRVGGMDDTDDVGGLDSALAAKTLLRIKDLGRKSRAIGLRLRVGDIVVAVDGREFHGSPAELTDYLNPVEVEEDTAEDGDDLFLEVPEVEPQEPKYLISIYRGNVFFEVFAQGPLGCDFDYVMPEEAAEIIRDFSERKIHPIEDYIGYEVFRDITRKCILIDQTPSVLPAVAPPLWLLEQRMLEPLLAVMSIYALTFGINIFLFIITYILTALYFFRGQLIFRRSYAMFEQRHMWMYLVATNPRDAQVICRRLDPKAAFEFSLIPPPRPVRKTANASS